MYYWLKRVMQMKESRNVLTLTLRLRIIGWELVLDQFSGHCLSQLKLRFCPFKGLSTLWLSNSWRFKTLRTTVQKSSKMFFTLYFLCKTLWTLLPRYSPPIHLFEWIFLLPDLHFWLQSYQTDQRKGVYIIAHNRWWLYIWL